MRGDCPQESELNGITNVELVHAAVAAIPGEVSFAEGCHIGRSEMGQDTQIVKAVTVDDLAKKFGIPDVLFIDVEGYECQVLHGAQETLKNRPDLFIEVHVGVGLESFGGSASELLGLIPTGSNLYIAAPHDGQFVPLALSMELIQKRFFLVALEHARSTSLGAGASYAQIAHTAT